VPTSEDILRLDLNGKELLPIHGFDVALFSGVLEYVHDYQRLVDYLADYFTIVVCSYAPFRGGGEEEIHKRRYSGWFSDHTELEFRHLFEKRGFVLVASSNWKDQLLFRFEIQECELFAKPL
jgi:hypothetical protein